MANRWLLKTEPSCYSFAHLQKEKKAVWDDVRNPVALKNLNQVAKGDLCFIYHTGDEKAVVGVARALGAAYPDPKKDDSRLVVVELEAVKPLPHPVTLKDIKANKTFAGWELVRLPRLSVMGVSADQWAEIERMAKR